jgi:hypothetical protein
MSVTPTLQVLFQPLAPITFEGGDGQMNAKTKGLLLALVIVGIGVSMIATTQALAYSNQTVPNPSGTLNDDSCGYNTETHQYQYRNHTMQTYPMSGQHHGCMH